MNISNLTRLFSPMPYSYEPVNNKHHLLPPIYNYYIHWFLYRQNMLFNAFSICELTTKHKINKSIGYNFPIYILHVLIKTYCSNKLLLISTIKPYFQHTLWGRKSFLYNNKNKLHTWHSREINFNVSSRRIEIIFEKS